MSADTPKFRIGSVQYLNAVPLTRGMESEVVFATPGYSIGWITRGG
jgi:hypothetical protein